MKHMQEDTMLADWRRMIEYAGTVDHWEIEDILTEVEEGIVVQRAYLFTEVVPGKPVKIYFCFARPATETVRLPAILHIHGGNQTLSVKDAQFWSSRGFASLSYDWTGPYSGRQHASDLGGMPSAMLGEDYNPDRSVMLTRLLLARTMLSWLLAQSVVDHSNVGVYGISWGGSIAWLLNHYDRRLKAVASVYGCGGHLAPGRYHFHSRNAQTAASLLQWNRALDGVALASEQHAPMLMLAATNDFWGWHDTVNLAVSSVPGDRCSVSCSANQDHHLDEWSAPTLVNWMFSHLRSGGNWPKPPTLIFGKSEQGNLTVQAAPDRGYGEIRKIRICYSFGDDSVVASPGRYWRTSEPASAGAYIFEITVPDSEDIIQIYADAVYADGVKVSSLTARVSADYWEIRKIGLEPSGQIADFSNGLDGWHCPYKKTEPLSREFVYEYIADPNGRMAVSLPEEDRFFSVTTFKLQDMEWRGNERCQAIQFTYFSGCAGTWTFSMIHRPRQAGEHVWACTVNDRQSGWTTVELAATDFIRSDGTRLPGWSMCHQFTAEFIPDPNLQMSGPTGAFGNVKWISR